jgi:hypothetical protein
VEARGDEEVIDLGDVKTLHALGRVEFRRAEAHHLRALRVRAGENYNARAHLGEELDCKVPEAADAVDSDAVGGTDIERLDHVEDSHASAHERGGVLWRDAYGNLEEERRVPDGV